MVILIGIIKLVFFLFGLYFVFKIGLVKFLLVVFVSLGNMGMLKR